MVEYTWQPEDRDGGLRWQSQRQRSKSRLRSRGRGDRPHPQHQPEQNSLKSEGCAWLSLSTFNALNNTASFQVFYQDEGVDTSLLAAEAGCACSESWKGGYRICLKSFPSIFWQFPSFFSPFVNDFIFLHPWQCFPPRLPIRIANLKFYLICLLSIAPISEAFSDLDHCVVNWSEKKE